MRKKYLSALLFGALLMTSAGTFTSCKDYDDEINDLQEQVNTIKSDLESLKATVDGLDGVKTLSYVDGKLIIETGKGSKVEVDVPSASGITEVKLEGNILYVDGKEAGKVEIGEGATAPVITVKDGKLYVDDKLMDIAVGDKVTVVDNGDTVTLNVAGQAPVELAKAGSAVLSSIQIQSGENIGGAVAGNIQWSKASKATPDWNGTKGAVKYNQLLIGQISTSLVQVTPADYDLSSQKLTLVDSKGNEAPVIVNAKSNNKLLSRSNSSTGSWELTFSIDETKVNASNIEKAFNYDPEGSSTDKMAYTLCVNGKPFTTYDFSVNTDTQLIGTHKVDYISSLEFVDAKGYVRRTTDSENGKLPVGTTSLILNNNMLYDYYYTFEGTNKSLAEQYGITIGEDKKSIIVPEGAEGVKIQLTVHTMSITGEIAPRTGETSNKVNLVIAGSEVTAETLATTTHQIVPGEATKEIKVEFGNGEDNVFAKFPAAAREAVKANGTFTLKESSSQIGFLVGSNSDNKFSNYSLYKENGTVWSPYVDDILDLSYMTITVDGNIADDATPGEYSLTFVAEDKTSTTTTGNELIKVNIPISVTVPTFEDIFTKDANWNEAKDTYTARILINRNDPELRFIDAFDKNSEFSKAEVSHIGLIFNAVNNEYPILGWTEEFVTEDVKAVILPINQDVTLDKAVIYDKEQNYTALKVEKLTDMKAYYNLFDGVSVSDETRRAFTVVSKEFTAEIKTALDGVEVNYYKNGVKQNNVTLNADFTLTVGSGAGTAASPFNGFMFELNGDEFFVHKQAFAWASGTSVDKLDKFNLYDNITSPIPSMIDNQVSVEFSDANGSGLKWTYVSTNMYYLGYDNMNGETSTLKVKFTDATGIEYVRELKVQKAK